MKAYMYLFYPGAMIWKNELLGHFRVIIGLHPLEKSCYVWEKFIFFSRIIGQISTKRITHDLVKLDYVQMRGHVLFQREMITKLRIKHWRNLFQTWHNAFLCKFDSSFTVPETSLIRFSVSYVSFDITDLYKRLFIKRDTREYFAHTEMCLIFEYLPG